MPAAAIFNLNVILTPLSAFITAFHDLLKECRVHDLLCTALSEQGYQSISDFAWAFPSVDRLSIFINALPESTAQGLTTGDLESSVEIARLRKALDQCHKKTQAPDAGTASPGGAQASASALPSQPSQWMEHLPPRLTQEAVQDMIDKFKANYPGELLDQDSMPSIRLLSLVHHSLKPGEKLRWIPWQFRLFAKQYQEHMEAKSAKAIRTEAQIIASAFFDETPEVPVEHMRLAAAWLERIQTVFRNAWALCGAAHLQNLKALDKKVRELCLQQPDAQLGLRTPTTGELIAADRKIWAAISDLVAQSWSLDDALHELTAIRNDVSSLLQLRPRALSQVPPPPPKPDRSSERLPKKGRGKPRQNHQFASQLGRRAQRPAHLPPFPNRPMQTARMQVRSHLRCARMRTKAPSLRARQAPHLKQSGLCLPRDSSGRACPPGHQPRRPIGTTSTSAGQARHSLL